MQDEICHFRFIPLSPVHIGSGLRLNPEDYLLRMENNQKVLLRFDHAAVLRSFSPQQLAQYETASSENRLSEALQMLRQHVEASLAQNPASPLVRHRTLLGQGSAREVTDMVQNPARRGEIHALPRHPYTGDILIPGSAIKGAIRTAVLSALLNPTDQEVKARLHQHVNDAKQQDLRNSSPGREPIYSQALKALSKAAFQAPPDDTAADPFRALEVSDAVWPAHAVRIDQARLCKLNRDSDATQKIQLHLERLLSQADGATLPDCQITIRLRSSLWSHPDIQCPIKQRLSLAQIIHFSTTFFVNCFMREANTFKELLSPARPWQPDQQQINNGALLLRVGRHCHFDSLSVDELRAGWNDRKKQPISEIGSTRTLCDLASEEPPLRAPFGWVFLQPLQS